MKRRFLLFVVTAMATIAATAQTPTSLGIGITNPSGNLHVHSLEEPLLPPDPNPIRDYFPINYYGIFRMTNGNTGTSYSDGFSIQQDNHDLTFTQHENGFVLWSLPQNGKVWMLKGGRVGIGDTTAGYKLAVGGAARITGNLSVGGNITSATANVTNNLTVGGATAMSGTLTVGNSGFTATALGNVSVGHILRVGNDAVYITSAGNMSVTGNATINSATMGSATIGNGFYCDATGHLKVKELRVTLTDWPDYVFGKGYRLMPLGEVEEYISDNGHLPQMPSAAEVEQDGADLGEMNRLLLQKVEELTLYIIDLQKQVDELKSNK